MLGSKAGVRHGVGVGETPPADDVVDRTAGHVQQATGAALSEAREPNQPDGVARLLKGADLRATVARVYEHGMLPKRDGASDLERSERACDLVRACQGAPDRQSTPDAMIYW